MKDTYTRTRPTFNSEIMGKISYGPAHALTCSFVSYRNKSNQYRCYCDLRMFSYNTSKAKMMASKKGITLPREVALGIYNALIKLPIDAPALKKDYDVIAKFKKYSNVDVLLGLQNSDMGVKIDIREWVKDNDKGYTGFSANGVKTTYKNLGALSDMILLAYNKIEEHGKEI